jgi:hypothetical protein
MVQPTVIARGARLSRSLALDHPGAAGAHRLRLRLLLGFEIER